MSSLYFKGKSAVWNHHLSVPYHTLDKDKKNSLKGENEDENLIIEGDNLLALKTLLPKYQGKIKCIYIDPPYNTGNEGWVYNDNVNSPLIKDWLGKVVGKDDLTRHDKWLCMMTPRLNLLKELLSENGSIFVSIDDNEVSHLKNLMDDVFGSNNFVEQIIVQTNPRGSQASIHFASTHEYLLVYAKRIENLKINGREKDEEGLNEYAHTEKDGRKYRLLGLRQRGGAWKRADRPNMFYPIYVNLKNGSVSLEKNKEYNIQCLPKRPTGEEGRWTWSKNKVQLSSSLLCGRKVNRQGEKDFWDIFRKDYANDDEGNEKQTKIKSVWLEKEMNYQTGRNAIKELFDNKDLFDYPKPVELIKKVLIASTDKDSIILDSFAGSGTTAQAVMELNQYDNGNRHFVLIQIEESLKKESVAYKEGYRFVSEITKDRVQRVIDVDELKDGFTYYTLGPSIDADSLLSGKLPKYEEFAKYVFYLATGKNHPDEKKIKEKEYFVGKSSNESIYLIYEKNLDSLKKLAITLEWAENTNKKDNSKKIVYAPACFLDDEHLEKFNIQFVSIPYNLFEKK
ncbi:MAG: site-specific DNA-methyltransferase [Candidatus Paceibacterota bacterium]|jgi:adenine-specific DNA-methyltransferase